MKIPVRIILEQPLPGVPYSLQKGSGSKAEIVQLKTSGTEDLPFDLKIELKGDEQKDPLPDFKGPFVEGSAGGRFIYLRIGIYAGVADSEWARRLKVPLTGISWEMIKQLAANPSFILSTTVPGKDKHGAPACATVKPFDGWKIL